MDDNRARIDEIFNHLHIPGTGKEPVEKTDESGDSDRVNFKDVLNTFIGDYSDKLGLGIDVSTFRVLKNIEPDDKVNYLPFLASSLSLAMHYNKAVQAFSKNIGVDMDDLYSQLLLPMFVVSASIATRIHDLPVAPDLDIDCLSETRFPDDKKFARIIADKFIETDDDNRHRWIMFLAFDATSVVMQAINAILHERANPIAMMMFGRMVEPMMAEIAAHFTSEMLATSSALDTMA